MKKILFVLIGFLIGIHIVHAQGSYQIMEAMDFYRANKMQSGDWMKALSQNDIEGSPYLNDEFVEGTLYTLSKVQYADIPLRYNIYNDNIEFRTPEEQVMALSAPETIEKVQIGDIQMAYVPYVNVKKLRRGFLQLLEEGNASLYSRSTVIFKKAEEPGAYKEAEPARFIRKSDSYYIRIGKGEAKLVSNKKELLEAFPDKQKEIGAFIKKNKVKPNKLDELIELVKYYNKL